MWKSSSVLLSPVSLTCLWRSSVHWCSSGHQSGGGHQWWTTFRETQATCNHFLHTCVNVALITQCTFNFIIHCCHCNHYNDCAYCTLYTYILCITQPTFVNVSCDHIASLRLLEIQSKVLAFLRSWRWGAAGFADLPLNLRFQSFFWQKKAENNIF